MSKRSTSVGSIHVPQHQELCMPRCFTEHPFCKQIRILLDQEILQDTNIIFKPLGTNIRVSAFLLSIISPVFQRMVCGAFKESLEKQLELEEVNKRAFEQLLSLACGKKLPDVKELGDMVELAKLADRFQMSEVVTVLEDIILKQITIDVCAELLNSISASGLARLEEGCRSLALLKFEEVSQTPGFLTMSEETLSSLLDDNGLVAGGEEGVLEALLRWINGGQRNRRTQEELLSKIRFPLMDEEYLVHSVRGMLPDGEWATELLGEAVALKQKPYEERLGVPLRRLCARALAPRIGKGVAWERVAQGGERRLEGHTNRVFALAECAGRVCSGSSDGRIRVWNRATLEEERALQVGNDAVIRSLAAWEGRLISGHGDGRVRVWDVATGRCERVLQGHTDDIRALAVCGDRLVSGSDDRTLRVWGLGAGPAAWVCERTLAGHTGWVLCLAVWRGKAVSGSADHTIRVWDVATGAHEATLAGHTHWVRALVVHERRVYSSSYDRTIRVWAAGSWRPRRTVEAYPADADQCAFRLAVSGCKLVSGSADSSGHYDGHVRYEVRVWDLETLACERTLRQPPGAVVCSLLALDGEVWGGVGMDVVVWGRRS